jgi:lantibiotic modifying enzyme
MKYVKMNRVNQEHEDPCRFRHIGLLVALLFFFSSIFPVYGSSETDWQDKAIKAAHWINSHAVKTPHGLVWPTVPGESQKKDDVILYSGTPGVILFFLELYYSTGDKAFLDTARKGADHLLAILPKEKHFGLYSGIAGIGFALEETYRASGDKKYRQGVMLCVDMLKTGSKKMDKGIRWDPITDIISGSAGVGLFLLYLDKKIVLPALKEMAVQAGERLLDIAIPAKKGLKWPFAKGYKRLMPNFSHGTAGVSYFLADLYKATGKKKFLEAALKGAHYLLEVANKDNDSCLIFHHEPEGEDLFYLGWCHGPAGTARLFYRLYQLTEDRVWLAWVEKSINALLESGIPEKQTPGFWNNVGRCCGTAGVADFLLDIYRITKNEKALELAVKSSQHILKKASPVPDDKKAEGNVTGLKWIQAEHRRKPDFLQAQTGLMQGAAGIGLWFLKLDAFKKGKKEKITFPDSPF